MDSLGLIHMNGRIYDPKLARFLQADPFIQAASHTQSYNRYSYLWNNPLNATDPSGFFLKKLWTELRPMFGALVGIAIIHFAPPAGWLMNTWYGAATTGAISGAAGAAANGGKILRGALTGAVSGAAFYGIGKEFSGLKAVGAHATTGGLISLAQGGKFGHGFVSAGLTKAFNINRLGLDGASKAAEDAVRTLVAGLVGGTISAATGGKFANGATTAALAQALDLTREKNSAAGEGGATFTKLNDKETEKALLTQASEIADKLGAPGGEAKWHYSGVDSIDCGGTPTYGCANR